MEKKTSTSSESKHHLKLTRNMDCQKSQEQTREQMRKNKSNKRTRTKYHDVAILLLHKEKKIQIAIMKLDQTHDNTRVIMFHLLLPVVYIVLPLDCCRFYSLSTDAACHLPVSSVQPLNSHQWTRSSLYETDHLHKLRDLTSDCHTNTMS